MSRKALLEQRLKESLQTWKNEKAGHYGRREGPVTRDEVRTGTVQRVKLPHPSEPHGYAFPCSPFPAEGRA